MLTLKLKNQRSVKLQKQQRLREAQLRMPQQMKLQNRLRKLQLRKPQRIKLQLKKPQQIKLQLRKPKLRNKKLWNVSYHSELIMIKIT